MRRRSLALLASLLASLPLLAAAATVDVAAEPGALATAVAGAAPGDVLRLAPGRHRGPITIAKPLTLRGDGEAIVAGNGEGTVITVDAPGVALGGIEVTGSGLRLDSMDAGVKLTEAADEAVVENSRIVGNLIGVHVEGPDDALIRNNAIVGREDLRLNERGNGVWLWNTPGTRVVGNEVSHGRDGIFVTTSRDNVFSDNRFENVRFAVHYMYTNDSEVSGNVSVGNHLGYALMYSTGLTVRGNVSKGDRDHGVMLNYANESLIENNAVIGGRDKCLFVYNSNKNRVAGNRFEGCSIGIHFTAGSERNAINNNAFVSNRTQVMYVGTRHLDWSEGGTGNYWSDHPTFDLDGDGRADLPYRPNDAVDRILWTQPLAKMLLNSPALQLLRWAHARFPSLGAGGVVDTAPLMRPPRTNPSLVGLADG